MTFSYNKAMVLRPKKEKALSTFLFALIIGAATLLPYILTNIELLAESARVGLGSLGMIYLPGKEIAAGNKLLLIDNFGIFFGSPLGFLSLLPEWVLPYVFGGLMVLRVAFAALAAYFFIRRFVRMPETARFGAFLYAFSSAVIGITVNSFLNNSVVLFPIILLAAEKLMTENRKMLLFISLFVCAVINSYAVWSIGVFLIIYLVIRLSSADVKGGVSVVSRLAAEIALAVLLAAVILVPLSYICIVNNFSYFEYIGLGALIKEGGLLGIGRAIFFPAESLYSPVALGETAVSGGLFGAYLPILSISGVIAFCAAKRGKFF